MINGEKIFKDDKIKSINPADTSQVIANASKATKQDVEDAFKQQTKLINLGKHGQQLLCRAYVTCFGNYSSSKLGNCSNYGL
ncbi:hypothetical protein ACVXZZ_05395 [Staphylococcus aureus]